MAEKWTDPQLRAIEHFGHNIIVSAGAGSGKTAVLSQRVYYLVGKRKIDIDSLLVLTFTNKAAAEMKTRIRKKISEDREGLFSEDEKKRQINMIDSSFIMTFDAYALLLVKKYHDLLGIDRDISIIDANILYNETMKALDELMEERYRSKDEGFERLIRSFCVKEDKPIREAVLKISSKLETIYDRDSYIENYAENFYAKEAIDGLLKEIETYLLSKIRTIRGQINEFSFAIENVSDYYNNIDSLLQAKDLKEIHDACMITEATNRKLPKGSGVSELKKQITKEINDLKKIGLLSKEEMVSELNATKDDDLVLLDLCEDLTKRLSRFKKETGLYAFGDIFRMAIDLVEKHPQIAKEIAEGFGEILIDEYQDTNDLQDEFIRRIARDNVYMVGDVKQSIYRFRNANPVLFMKKYVQYRSDGVNELIELPHNFRSRREIIEDINVIFDRLMDERIGGADYKADHHMINGRNDGVYEGQDPHLEILNYPYEKNIAPFDKYTKKEAEAFIMAEDIGKKVGTFTVRDGDLLRKAEYRDFCIIVDRTANFDLYKQVLSYYGIPSIIEKDEKISDSDLIYALKAVFGLLEKMSQGVEDDDFVFSYVSLARSFLVDLKDEEIYDIVTHKTYRESRIWKMLEPLVLKVASLSITQILDEIIDLFDVYEKLIRIGDVQENLIKIDYLYQLSASLNEGGYDYSSFNDYLNSLFDEGNDRDITYAIDKGKENAVKIINIHKSKGLQYKICYFPSLDTDFNTSDLKDRITFTRDRGVILPVAVEGRGLKESLRKVLYREEYRREDIGEKLRLLYVGLTRAEEKMIMVASLSDESKDGVIVDDETRKKYRNFADMLNSIYADLDEHRFIRPIDLNDYVFSKDYLILKEKDVVSLIDRSAAPLKEKKYETIEAKEVLSSHFSKNAGLIDQDMIERMELGTKLHYYLETLDFIHPDLSQIEERYAGLIENFLSCDIMKDAAKGKSYREYEFIYEEDNEVRHGFIDLLMEYDDHFDIIDYKTKNIDDEHYDEQLNGYRKYISSISDKKVYCYLYSIVDSTYREVKQ